MKSSLALSLILITAAAAFGQPDPGVSLSVSTEVVPAGGVAQVKVFLTEPKPIVRTGMVADFEEAFFGEFLGIAAGGGLTGVAQIHNGRLRVELSTLTPTGLDSDYPILTIAVATRPNLPHGATMPVNLDLGQSSWLNPAGRPYLKEAKPGAVTIGGSMYIGNVLPGGGTRKPGDTFRVVGQGFIDGVRARAEGARLQSFTPAELVMVAEQRIQLDGTRIRVELPNREQQTYFSYLRGARAAPSADPALQGMIPVFSGSALSGALVPLSPRAGFVVAIGLQNPGAEPVQVDLGVVSLIGRLVAKASLGIAPRQTVFRSAAELFGTSLPEGTLALFARSGGAFQLSAAEVESAGNEIRVPVVISLGNASY